MCLTQPSWLQDAAKKTENTEADANKEDAEADEQKKDTAEAASSSLNAGSNDSKPTGVVPHIFSKTPGPAKKEKAPKK